MEWISRIWSSIQNMFKKKNHGQNVKDIGNQNVIDNDVGGNFDNSSNSHNTIINNYTMSSQRRLSPGAEDILYIASNAANFDDYASIQIANQLVVDGYLQKLGIVGGIYTLTDKGREYISNMRGEK